jgi:hypothetical protein
MDFADGVVIGKLYSSNTDEAEDKEVGQIL